MPAIRSPRVVPETTVGLLASATGPANSAARTAVPSTALGFLVPLMPPRPPHVALLGDECGASRRMRATDERPRTKGLGCLEASAAGESQWTSNRSNPACSSCTVTVASPSIRTFPPHLLQQLIARRAVDIHRHQPDEPLELGEGRSGR